MDSRWFLEDRKLPRDQQAKAKQETEKALKTATILTRRLVRILEEEVAKTIVTEEEYEGAGWKRKILRAATRRATLREIIKLLP